MPLFSNPTNHMRLPSLRFVRPIVVTLALLSCTENGPVGPTFDASARLNTAGTSQSVVLSQVYGGGGNSGATYKNDFIEIFNNGNDAVNVTGWTVQYGSAANNFSLKTTLTGTIQPGRYLLIQEAAGAAGTTSLPTPDILTGTGQPAGASINLSGTDGKVALVRNGTILACGAAATPCNSAFTPVIADLIGYGTSAAAEGTAIGALSNTTSASRNLGGCTDTDNNLSDFSRGAVAPRNSATAANVCGAPAVTVSSVTLSPSTVAPAPPTTIAYHGTQQFTATARDQANNDITATNPISWSIAPSGIATISSTGLVTSTGFGDVTVTASAGGKSASTPLHINPPAPPPTVHFSEIHYDNSGSDVNEKIEIEGPANTDLTGWQVVLYGGDAVPDFSAYSTTTLGVALPTSCGTTGVIVVNYDVNGIKNAKFGVTGNPAGMALVNNTGAVVEFLSYEGTFTASDGPAAGKTSTDIGVAEEPAPAPGNSLHRNAAGIWSTASAQDFGVCNGTGGPPPTSTNNITFTGRLATDPALPVGFEDQLFATEKDGATGATISTTFTWLAETPAIATIDADGVMHAVAAGNATFRATATDGSTASYTLAMVTNVFSTTADWSGNLEFGTPIDNNPADDHIITHDQFTTSYSYERNNPNWVSAKMDVSHYGSGSDRCDCFTFDPAVPSNLYYTTQAYTGVGAVWNRGHLLRSADVEATASDNSIAYYFSNIAPQSADMNQGPWAVEENFLGDLAKTGGKDVYEIMGTTGSQGTLKNEGKVNIPLKFWKVAVIVPHGKKLADIHSYTDLQVIAVIMPNVAGIKNVDWNTYKTTTDAVEALSGYDLLSSLPDDIELLVESNDRPPTAVMSGPDAGSEGSALSFSGSGSSDPDAGDVLTYSWNFGDNTAASGVNPSHVFADDGQYIVTLTVSDQIGAKSTTTKVVTVSNVSPSGSFASPAPVNEGESYTLSISNVTDPSATDAAAGFSYRFDCGNGFGAWSSTASASCFAADNPGSPVAAEVKDKDNGVAHYAGTAIVSNVTPTAMFSNNGPINEGTGFTLRLDGASDPSPSDIAAGLQYRFDCGSGPGMWQYSATAFCPAADNGSFSVSGEVKDKDGASSMYSATVLVNNVAPTADFSSNGPVNEGQSYTLSLANGSDISSVDMAAGLQYRFDCGRGFGSWGSSASVSCPAPDHGVFNVAGEVRDKDLAVSSYAGSVTVNNVAPTALFLYSGSVNEGSPLSLKLENGTDSPSDVAAGLQYRFDCGSGFGSWGNATSVSCPTTDNGSRSVEGEIRDRDGAVSTYGGTVTVKNVAPTGTFDNAVSANEGSMYSLSITNADDPSSADLGAGFTYRFDCGTGFGSWSSSSTASCSASDNPGNATHAEIQDKDGGITVYDGAVAIANVAPTAIFSNNGPVNEGSSFTLTFTDGADASAADLAAGLQYRFNCGSGFADWSPAASANCPAQNHGIYAVAGEVRDKDLGATAYAGSVTVVNTAPTALFTFESSAVEGGTYTLNAANSSDSPADLAAGLQYRYDCGAGFGSWSGSTTHSCSASDNGSFTLGLEVRDQGGAFTAYTGTATVTNAAPSGSFSSATSATEGGIFTLSIAGGTDAGPVDRTAGFSYRFDCGAGPGAWTSVASAECTAGDNPGTATHGEIRDKDGAVTSYDGAVTVSNVAPTAVFASTGPVNEGSNFTLSLSDATDAAAADRAAGFSYRFNCGTGFAGWSATPSLTCTAPNHGTYAVGGEIQDKDGGVTTYGSTVNVLNTAPTALFTFESSAVEGGTYKLIASNGSDSPADLEAGLQYRFNCGSGFNDWGTATNRECVAADDGSFGVVAEVRDRSGSSSAYNGAVTVTNVAPTGTFATSAPVVEGSAFTLAVSNGRDASPVDQSAGFTYSFDCGTGFGAWGSSSSATCMATDNPGTQTRARIRDKDGAETTYTVFSGATNANPSVTVATAQPITSGGTLNLAGQFTDLGQRDGPWTYVINWGDGNSTGSANVQGAIGGSHQYFVAGTYSVTLTVKDKDGGVGSASTTLSVGRIAVTGDVEDKKIKLKDGKKKIDVELFGSSSFSVSSINVASIRIGRTTIDQRKEGKSPKVEIKDMNKDRISDMEVEFELEDLIANGDISATTTQLTLTATLNDGRQIQVPMAVNVTSKDDKDH